jgi:hypothetical protein
LLFGDDTIFFTGAHSKNVSNLKSILHIYSQGLRQKLNLQKSLLFFGIRCPNPVKKLVMEALEGLNVSSQSNYLGMPIYVGQSETCAFNFISESMWRV